METIILDKQLVVAEAWADATGSGYSWTLASRLGEALREAQARFGPRDPEWTILGYEFGPGAPQLWYPSGGSKMVIIQLADNARENAVTAYWQLAHECVHLLAPGGKLGTETVLEEGAAALFADDYARTNLKASGGLNQDK